jgi:hypothetical protein
METKLLKLLKLLKRKLQEDDINSASTKVGGIGSIFADSDDEDPTIYRLRNDVVGVNSLTEKVSFIS